MMLMRVVLQFLIASGLCADLALPFSIGKPTTNARRRTVASRSMMAPGMSDDDGDDDEQEEVPAPNASGGGGGVRKKYVPAGKLKQLKKKEAELSGLLAAVRREKLSAIQARPLTIGVVGFGRFGQFISTTFAKYGRVVVTSRSDYTERAAEIGAKYIPLEDKEAFLDESLDVMICACSIVSFEDTIRSYAPYIENYISKRETSGASSRGPLVVDVLSVKEHARNHLLDILPEETDILCTHPMFGPNSGKDGWSGLNFVYEKTRINGVLLDPNAKLTAGSDSFVDSTGATRWMREDNDVFMEGMDRMERFLSIWEEEGCHMVQLSCKAHDEFAANSQFITHLIARVLGSQGLAPTPIDTSGFESVLKLIKVADDCGFDLFYGLYKYNDNSVETIENLQSALDDVVDRLHIMEQSDDEKEEKAEAAFLLQEEMA